MMYSNIKKARMAAGLSQKQVALELGVSAPTVSDWEAEKIFPNARNLISLARLFSVSTDYLLGRTDIPDMARPLGAYSALPYEERKLLAAYRQADDRARQMVALALEPYVEASAPPAQAEAAG